MTEITGINAAENHRNSLTKISFNILTAADSKMPVDKSPPSELSSTTRRNGVDKPAYLIANSTICRVVPNKDSGSEGESSKAARKANKWP